MGRLGGPRPLTTAQQYLDLRHEPLTCRGHGALSPRGLTWEFEACPTPMSRSYVLRLAYAGAGSSPDVTVTAPALDALADGRALPHVYDQRPPRLCLYLPGAGEWGPEKRLTRTIVPWTVLWLFFFEEWLLSDDWKGGGEHPPARNERR